jgi:hypothetical protein
MNKHIQTFGTGLWTIVVLSYLLSALLWRATVLSAEPLSLGFPLVSGKLSVLDGAQSVAYFARDAVCAFLVRSVPVGQHGKSSMELDLADYVNYDPEAGLWSLRLRPGASFPNGRSVLASDVEFSLKRCAGKGALSGARLREMRRREAELWFDFEVSSQERIAGLIEDLSGCAIVEQQSSVVFGTELGSGTSLVSPGKWGIADYAPGNSLWLSRYRDDGTLEGAVLELRMFKDPNHGLTALRTGTIAALFTSDAGVLARAGSDETLTLSKCYAGSRAESDVIVRKGFEFSCYPGLNPGAFRYAS